MATWSDWMNAGTKFKILELGNLTNPDTTNITTEPICVGEGYKNGFDSKVPVIFSIPIVDEEVRAMFIGADVLHCAVIAYNLANRSSFYTTVMVEWENDEVVVKLTTLLAYDMYEANGKVAENLYGLSLLFVSE